jgi:PEP-CTERM motif
MKINAKAFALLASLAVLAPPMANAQTPPANTGAAGNVNGSFQDAFWQVSTDGGANWASAFQVQNPPGVWQANTASYSWISATSSGSGGGGNYWFRTFFDLTGFVPSTARLSFQCAIDNYPDGINSYYSLNGGAYAGNCGNTFTGYQFGGLEQISSGFVGGSNELLFHFIGDSITDGLVVGDMSLSARVVATPEPASMLLVATGLVGIIGVARHRSA